ncbi:hypothetical protein N658DRAFT_448267 [Parathielavia hyrcaniae]|uniref:Zn(2)-C6 fungal-type domain-containing protein n=1 Tax=Parathielavia hyrcaniae TaxID=113614 RepID=A0AAN6Q1K8_9PEZI|nr:hypothetical protein N658DRAFT_448267 [Parathielavia hyrcaniae]
MSSTSPGEGLPGANATRNDVKTDKQDARPPPRKRRRIVISCIECHRRKQKCDRGLPCANCVSRNKQGACRYETGAPTAKKHGSLATAVASSASSLASSSSSSSAPDSCKPTSAVAVQNHDHPHSQNHDHDNPHSTLTKAEAFGYSQTGASTLDFLHHIETSTSTTDTTTNDPTSASPTSSSSASPHADDHHNHTTANDSTRDHYRTLMRQLPPRRAIERLAALYFAAFGWQYGVLDASVFAAQLDEWYRLPFSLLAAGGPGPAALSAEMRAFPAVVLLVCAVALLVVDDDDCGGGGGGGDGYGGRFGELKYAGGMTFEDLAREYSDGGVEILRVLGKRGMGLNTVLAGWLRTAWLKYAGLVTESWHAVGSAIRDAQEIGLHRDSLDPKPRGGGAEAALENQWLIERRRKMWLMLAQWDIHMAAVLGRPTNISLSMAPPSLPVDAPVSKDPSTTPVRPRGGNDPPTPLTRAIWSHHLMEPLKEIVELEKEGPCPRDFARVDRLHHQLLDVDARTPSFFRLSHPDTRFDDLPECRGWLPAVRVLLPQLTNFELMALHRPYIFTRPTSRTEALKASLAMLHAQRLQFMALKPQMYKTFSLFFGTFDAIVLMASIYILFPKEHPELVRDALQHFQWAVQRFEAMSQRNPLAKAALGVLRAISLRLKKSLGISTGRRAGTTNGRRIGSTRDTTTNHNSASCNPSPCSHSQQNPSTFTPPTTKEDEFSPPQRTHTSGVPQQQGCAALNAVPTSASSSNPTPTFHLNLDPDLFAGNNNNNSNNTGPINDGPFDWNPPTDFDWASLQPIYATSDLLYHDLNGTFPMTTAAAAAPDAGGAGVDDEGWDYQNLFGCPTRSLGRGTSGLEYGSGGDDAAAAAAAAGLALGGGQGAGMGMGGEGGGGAGGEGLPAPACRFQGDFGDDSVWNLLNQYIPF